MSINVIIIGKTQQQTWNYFTWKLKSDQRTEPRRSSDTKRRLDSQTALHHCAAFQFVPSQHTWRTTRTMTAGQLEEIDCCMLKYVEIIIPIPSILRSILNVTIQRWKMDMSSPCHLIFISVLSNSRKRTSPGQECPGYWCPLQWCPRSATVRPPKHSKNGGALVWWRWCSLMLLDLVRCCVISTIQGTQQCTHNAIQSYESYTIQVIKFCTYSAASLQCLQHVSALIHVVHVVHVVMNYLIQRTWVRAALSSHS